MNVEVLDKVLYAKANRKIIILATELENGTQFILNDENTIPVMTTRIILVIHSILYKFREFDFFEFAKTQEIMFFCLFAVFL